MPSHIFMRLGRYADAVRVNVEAIDADRRLDAQLRAQGLAPLGHPSHHHHFLWAVAAMRGDATTALQAARGLAAEAARTEQAFGASGTSDYFFALGRHSRGAQAGMAGARIGLSARGIALSRSGKPAAASGELVQLQAVMADERIAGLTPKGIDDLSALLALAEVWLRGEIALAQRQFRAANGHLRRAVELEDALESEEPPAWALPAAFRADLERYPPTMAGRCTAWPRASAGSSAGRRQR